MVLAQSDQEVLLFGTFKAQHTVDESLLIKVPQCVGCFPFAGGTIKSVACAEGFFLVLTSNQEIFGFGNPRDGEFGSQDYEALSWVPITHPDFLTNEITHIACCGECIFVVLNGRYILARGANGDGQLGMGYSSSTEPEFVRPNIGFIHDSDRITHISGGHYHAALVVNSERLYMTGFNGVHQLGLSGDYKEFTLVDHPTFKQEKIKDIQLGGAHSVVLTRSGNVLTVGWDSSGELGRASTPSFEVVKLDVTVAQLFVDARANRSMFLSTTNKVYGCGSTLSHFSEQPLEKRFMQCSQPVFDEIQYKRLAGTRSTVYAVGNYNRFFTFSPEFQELDLTEYLAGRSITHAIGCDQFCVVVIRTENQVERCFSKLHNRLRDAHFSDILIVNS